MLTSNTILFCPGAYVHHSWWDNWVAYFNDQGYEAIVPEEYKKILKRTQQQMPALFERLLSW